jgi:hypothetical protein
MNFIKYLLIFTVIFVSCKTKTYMIDASAVAKEMSAKKVARKHVSVNLDKKTLEAKMKVNFNNGKTKQRISVTMRIRKDEVIWLKGTKFLSIFKAKITPTKVRYYSPLAKHYFEGDFSMIKKLLGVEINFEQLQNLFLGQALQNVKEEKQDILIQNNSYVLSPEKQVELFDIFFTVNPSHFKLDSQSIVNTLKNQRLDVMYPSYNLIEDVVFPSEINIKATQAKKFTNIDFLVKSVSFNTDIDVSFLIPNGYKQLNF